MSQTKGTPLSREEINKQALATGHLMTDLGRRAARGSVIAVGAQVIEIIVTVATIVTLARLLTPVDFGLVAMAATVTAFISLFSTFGLQAATIQREELNQETVSALFYVNLALGIVIMLVAFAAAPVAAWGFNDERVSWLIVAFAIPIPLTAAAVQHRALLQRGMRWVPFQWTKLLAQFLGATVAILLAWKTDLGYWSLVAQAWVTSGLGLVFAWAICPWRPGSTARFGAARSALSFGLNLTGFNLVNYFHRQFDDVLIGWRWGAAELGYYTRAYKLLFLPISLISGPVASAVIPALSRLQGDALRWSNTYLEALGAVVLVSSGITALMIAAAYPLVDVLLGPGWSESAEIFRLLAISMFAATPMNATGWLYISLGQTRRMFKWALLYVPVLVLSFILGLPFGPEGVALSYSIAMCLGAYPCISYAARCSPINAKTIIRTIFWPTLAGILATCAGLAWSTGDTGVPVVDAIVTMVVTGAVYLICVAVIINIDPYHANLRKRLSERIMSINTRRLTKA